MLINILHWFLSCGKLYLQRLKERKRNLNTQWWKYWWHQCNPQIWHNIILENEFASGSWCCFRVLVNLLGSVHMPEVLLSNRIPCGVHAHQPSSGFCMTVNKSSHQQGAKLRCPAPGRCRNPFRRMSFYGQALRLAVIWQWVAKAGNEAGLWGTDSKKSEHELKLRYLPVCLPKAVIIIAWAGIGNERVNAVYYITSEGGVLNKSQSRSCWWNKLFTKGILRDEGAFSAIFRVNVNKYTYFVFLIRQWKQQ